jgi:hypothetical protein
MNLTEGSDNIFAICVIAVLAFSFGYGFLSPYLKKKGVSENKILLIVKSSVVVILLAGTYAYRNIS